MYYNTKNSYTTASDLIRQISNRRYDADGILRGVHISDSCLGNDMAGLEHLFELSGAFASHGPGRHVNLVPTLGRGAPLVARLWPALILGERDCSSGATFPASAAHGCWGGGKVLAALLLLRRAFHFLLRLCTTSPSVCVCSRTYSWSSSLEAFFSTN